MRHKFSLAFVRPLRCSLSAARIAQAFAAYGMSFLFVRSGGDCLLLFALGSCALVPAFVVDLVVGAIGGRS